MGPKTALLLNRLEELATFLEGYNETEWNLWFRRAAAFINQDDYRGIEYILGAYGGMGSFNDLVLCKANGHRIDDCKLDEVNSRLMALRSEIYNLAGYIKRYHETS